MGLGLGRTVTPTAQALEGVGTEGFPSAREVSGESPVSNSCSQSRGDSACLANLRGKKERKGKSTAFDYNNNRH